MGAALVERIVADATALGFPTLHLFTTEAEGWYLPKGWTVRQRLAYHGHPGVVMALDLAP